MLSSATERPRLTPGAPGGRDQAVTRQSVNKHKPNKIFVS